MTSLIDRFEGAAGAKRLRQAMLEQRIIRGCEPLAAMLEARGVVRTVDIGDVLIEDGAATNELFLVLSGRFSIRIKGSEVAVRTAGEHVGEQAVLDPAQTRSAAVVALVQSVVLEIGEDVFEAVAAEHPVLWRNMARELSRRLVQRNRLVRGANAEIQIFIISSKEALWIAEEVRAALNSNDVLCTVWTDGVFRAGLYSLEALEQALDDKDFAIAVAAADDFLHTRGQDHVVPRDNVIFELGMFMGRLGRERTILLEPRDEPVKLPSDLLGLTTIPYKPGPKNKLPILLGGPCQEIRRVIEELQALK